MKKHLFTLLLACLCFSGLAQVIDPDLALEMSNRGENEKIKVHILMKAKPDQTALLRQADYYVNQEERRIFVVNELKKFATASQFDLQNALREMQRNGLVENIHSNWIANMIACEATKSAVNDIASRNDVEIIGFNADKNWIPDGEVGSPVPSTREITQNVTQVNADKVWGMGYTGLGVVVAVIDTGVNYNHVDVADHLWDGGEEFPHHGYDVINHDNDPMDDMGHGSHCAGTVCGDGKAGRQTGMAPDATLMCVKCLDASGGGNATNISDGIQWAVEHGCNLFSMSLGIANSTVSERTLLRHTCENALAAGVVAAIAAGNEGDMQWMYPVPNNVRVPGSCPPPYIDPDQAENPGALSCSVCIGAVDYNDNAAYFTSNGPVTWTNTEFGDYAYNPGIGLIRPDVCAPGVDIISLNYATNNGYTSMSGTSMATPCAAGVMCLLLSKNINTTPADICRILEETALPKSETKSNIYGFGRIDALAAIEQIQAGAFAYASHSIDDAQGNNNGKANPDETISLTLALQNVSENTVSNATIVLSSDDQYVTITENTTTIASAMPNETVTLNDAFTFTVADNAPAIHSVRFSAETFINGESDGKVNFTEMICDYNLTLGATVILNDDNDNGLLEPGENADLRILIDNTGNELAQSVIGLLSTDYQYAILNETEKSFSTIGAEMMGFADYNITLDAAAPADFVIPFNLLLTDAYGRETELTFNYKNACNVIFDLRDSYGDGWQGNYLEVSYSDGTPTEQMTVQSGSSASFTREIASGVHVTITFHQGSWPEECSYTISYEDGTQIMAGTTNGGEFDVNCSGGGPAPVFCEPIGELTAEADGFDVILSWEAPEEGNPTGYEIYRETVLLETVTDLTYIDAEVAEGLYNYCVYAVYDDCQSEFVCAEVEVSACSAVNNLAYTLDSLTMNLTWELPDDPIELIQYQILVNGEIVGTTGLLDYQVELTSGHFDVCVNAVYPECEKSSCIELDICPWPENLSYTTEDHSFTLNWEIAEPAESYNIYSDGELIGTSTETTFTGELPSGSHTVCVEVDGACIPVPMSACAHIKICDPIEISNIAYTPANGNGIFNLSWIDPQAGAMSYDILLNGEFVTDTYDPWVSFNAHVEAGENEICIVPDSHLCDMDTVCVTLNFCEPARDVAYSHQGSEVTFTWEGDATEYQLFVDDEMIATVNETTYSTELEPGEYDFCVLTVNEGCYAEMACTHLVLDCVKPAGLRATDVREGLISLIWDAIASASSYDVYRNGELIAANLTENTYSDTQMAIDADHQYIVAAHCTFGSSDMSDEITVSYYSGVNDVSFNLSIFPNPTNDKVTVECEDMTGIEVYSIDGKRILNIVFEGDSYQLDGLNPGVYTLRVFKGNESVVRKVVKF